MVKANVHVVIVPPKIQVLASARNPGDVPNAFKTSTVYCFFKGAVRCAQKLKNLDETLFMGAHIDIVHDREQAFAVGVVVDVEVAVASTACFANLEVRRAGVSIALIALMVAPVATEVAGGILLQSGRAVQTTSSVLCRRCLPRLVTTMINIDEGRAYRRPASWAIAGMSIAHR